MNETPQPRESILYATRCAAGKYTHCDICSETASHGFQGKTDSEPSNLKDSAARGCETCEILTKAIEGIQQHFKCTVIKVGISFCASADEEFFVTSMNVREYEVWENEGRIGDGLGYGGDSRDPRRFFLTDAEIYIDTRRSYPQPLIGTARNVAATSDADQCYDLLKQWIADCKTHPKCNAGSEPATLPTRVIDIGQSNQDLKLYQTKGEVEDYVALSHCWGPDGLPDIAKTTRMTFDERLRGIQFSALPKSFQDAITITRRLGIRYIWIDSLSIIQQDKDDWEIESTKMGDIYAKAFLTLSVAHASSSDQGCFSSRAETAFSFKAAEFTKDGKTYDIYARTKTNHIYLTTDIITHETAPLFSRAWTFQERLLARRIVHYTENELVWECRTATDCECGSNQQQRVGSQYDITSKQLYSQFLDNSDNELAFLFAWYSLVRRFSQMRLTYGSDRLPALSGIAKDMQNEVSGAYLAGLWTNHLVEMLSWMVMSGCAYRAREGPRAPSWAWTSAEGAWIDFDFIPGKGPWVSEWPKGAALTVDGKGLELSTCTVVSVSCPPAGRDPTGQVLSASITLSGKMVPAKLSTMRGYTQKSVDDIHKEMISSRESLERNGVTQWFLADVPEEPDVYNVGDTVFCFMVGAKRYGERAKYPRLIKIASMVLRLASDSSPKTYERIGYFVLNNHFNWETAIQWWEGADETVITIK